MSEAQQDPVIFQDTFKILDVDPDGKKFDKGDILTLYVRWKLVGRHMSSRTACSLQVSM